MAGSIGRPSYCPVSSLAKSEEGETGRCIAALEIMPVAPTSPLKVLLGLRVAAIFKPPLLARLPSGSGGLKKVYSKTCTNKCATSGFGSRADMPESCGNVAFCPIGDTSASYSITSSAATCSVCGTESPNAFAVLRFNTNSNLVGCSTGRSAGLSPFRIRPE